MVSRQNFMKQTTYTGVADTSDGLSTLVSRCRWTLSLPAFEAERLQIEQCLQSADVVVDHREVLVLYRAAHLQRVVSLLVVQVDQTVSDCVSVQLNDLCPKL